MCYMCYDSLPVSLTTAKHEQSPHTLITFHSFITALTSPLLRLTSPHYAGSQARDLSDRLGSLGTTIGIAKESPQDSFEPSLYSTQGRTSQDGEERSRLARKEDGLVVEGRATVAVCDHVPQAGQCV